MRSNNQQENKALTPMQKQAVLVCAVCALAAVLTIGITLTTYITIDQHTRMNVIFRIPKIRSDLIHCEILFDILIGAEHANTFVSPHTTVGTFTPNNVIKTGSSLESGFFNLVITVTGSHFHPIRKIFTDFIFPIQSKTL